MERPSKEELKYLKGIIISGSIHTVLNKKLKEDDKNLFKKFHNEKNNTSQSKSSISQVDQSSQGSRDSHATAAMQRAAIDLIGEGYIPQNDKWIEKLSIFIKQVYDDHKHIKLIGCQFGSLLIAYALGGRVRDKIVSQTGENQKP